MVALPFCEFEIRASKLKNPKYPKALVTVGDHVRARRLDLGLTQLEAAKRIAVDNATVVNWENNRTGPQVRHLPCVIQFLGYAPFCECDNLAQDLVRFRRVNGFTREGFAQILSVDPSTLARWESGARMPKGAVLKRVVDTISRVK